MNRSPLGRLWRGTKALVIGLLLSVACRLGVREWLESLETGHMALSRGPDISRDTQPIAFWGALVFQAVLMASFVVIILICISVIWNAVTQRTEGQNS